LASSKNSEKAEGEINFISLCKSFKAFSISDEESLDLERISFLCSSIYSIKNSGANSSKVSVMLFIANILRVLPFEIKAEKNMFASTIRIIPLP
jgi:hypothetical protein